MSIFGIRRRYRELQRLTHVLQVLTKHGLGHFIERLDLRQYLPLPAKWKPTPLPAEPIAASHALAQRLVNAMQELGPTFVKLGQFLSTRPDILPPVYLEEFSRLQDDVAPFPAEDARRIVEDELAAPIGDLFAEFADEPVASGSIAQVHHATTADGEPVVVKIRRPGIERVISADLELLEVLAGRLEDHVPEVRVIRPKMIVDELGRHLRGELDFLQEAAATQHFHAAFAASERFRGPGVFWQLTTAAVLTMERLKGRRISHYVTEGSPEEKKHLAAALFDLYMKQFFQLGYFHADPHPGNLLVDESLCINVVDFGLSGHITEDLQGALGTAVLAIRMRDAELLSAILEDLGVYTEATDEAQVRADITNLMDTYIGMPLGRVDIGITFRKLVEIAQRNSLFLPRNFTLMGKALVTVAGLARSLDGEFDAMSALRPYVQMLLRKKFSYESLRKSAISMAFHTANLVRYAPADLRRVMRKILSGTLSMNFRHVGLDRLINDLDRSSNRLAFSIIVASLVIASSVILHAGTGPLLFGVPALGIVGYLLAAVLGLWLVWAILRSGRL
ncbi:MAG: ABC1 kinase family protein [Planctomycetota bacterium]